MFDLPKSTVVNKFIPKEKFYSKTIVNNKLRQQFTDEIEKITWINKISSDTLNITSKNYKELQIFEITLKGSEISQVVLKHIDTFIPYPIIFVIKRVGAVKVVSSYKEPNLKNEHQMKVDSYFETSWQTGLKLELKGRSVDEIYKNYLFQIEPKLLDVDQVDIKTTVEINREKLKIQKQIENINRQIANEPSISKRQELARIRRELENRF